MISNVSCLVLVFFFACNEELKNNSFTDPNGEIAVIRDVVHNFYKWYSFNIQRIEYVDSRGDFSKLDMTKVAAYHAQMMKSGFLSQTYIENDMSHLKYYEAIWAKENENGNEGVLSGEDYDRVFCGQDWDQKEYTTGKIKVDKLSKNQAKIKVGVSKLALVKENGRWLIAKISCE